MVMRTFVALCVMLSAAAASAASPSAESISLGSENIFLSVPAIAPLKLAAPAAQAPKAEPAFPFEVLDPKISQAPGAQTLGSVVGQVKLAALLDHHRDMLAGKTLGSKPYDISVAGDASFKNYFLTFQQPGNLLIAPLGELKRLTGDGIDVQIEPGVTYNFHVSINIFNPVRGSTMEIHAAQGTSGPDHDISTGEVLDRVKAKSFVFSARGNEYWTLFGTDVDPNTNQLANTRTLLFIHEAGTKTKAYPVAESALPVGQAVNVTLGDTQVTMTRGADGNLVISN